jgi:ABC-type antimicrobial peptide transport system permease subunit
MYLWKTHLLVAELKANSINENSLKNYYLATSILVSVCYYLALLEPRENFLAHAVEAIGTIVVTVLGINAAFKANGGVAGSGFLNKVVSIFFPLLIKVFVASLALGVLLAVLEQSGTSKSETAWVTSISIIAIQIVIFWRLVVHVRNTNA